MRPLRAFAVFLILIGLWITWRVQAIQISYAEPTPPAAPKHVTTSSKTGTDPTLAALAPGSDPLPVFKLYKHRTTQAPMSAHRYQDARTPPEPAPPPSADTALSDAHAIATHAYTALRQGERRLAYDTFRRAINLAPQHKNVVNWRSEARRLSKRWYLDAYSLLRGSGDTISGNAQPLLGGGQSGLEVRFTPNPFSRTPIAAYSRVTLAQNWFDFDGSSTQAAFGMRWSPFGRSLPHVSVERLVTLGDNGRDAWAARVAGGVQYSLASPLALDLSTYGEFGIIGAHSADLYAGGQAYGLRSVFARDKTRIALGGGLWAGMQNSRYSSPSRVDIGPSLQFSHGAGSGRVDARIEYRHKIVGNTKPGSGGAITLVTTF